MPPGIPTSRAGASLTFFPGNELARGFLVFWELLSAGLGPVLLEALPHSRGSSAPLSLGPENLCLQCWVRWESSRNGGAKPRGHLGCLLCASQR